MTEELKQKVEKILSYCQTQADIYNNYQLGTKVVINGIYGAFGFNAFYFYNPKLAESVTQQGKDAILNAEKIMNLWAKQVWQKDTKTHEKMGIKITDNNPINKNITVYIDTDSCASDTSITISDEVLSIETESGIKIYSMNDYIKILRDGVEMKVLVSDIKETDLIWVQDAMN